MSDAAKGVISLYERHARSWDRDRSGFMPERAWIERFATLLPPHGHVLDLGCGGGVPIARHLIELGLEVTGIDASGALIALCKERFPSARWIVADMRCLSLGRQYDGLLAWDSLFHLTPDDQREVFPLLRAHLAEAGALLFTSGPQHGEAVGSYRGEELYHGSLDEAEYRSLLTAHRFDVIAHTVEDPSCGYHTVWLARSRPKRPH